MNCGSLFSGIGGFDLAAEWMGWDNLFHCEWNPFGQKVLKYYWPNAESFTDITKTDFTKYANKIDILTGGFPCQPYSVAGKQLGKEDNRHLWPEMLRAIREIRPSWVVGENVRGLVNWSGGLVFDEVQADLENEGYEVLPFLLPACAVNAPHRRDRIWFIAHSSSNGHELRGFGEDRQEKGESEREGDKRERLRSDVGGIITERDAPNTKCERFQKPEQSEQQQPLSDVERENTSDDCKYGAYSCAFRGIAEMCDICEDRDNYEPSEDFDDDAADTGSDQLQGSIIHGSVGEARQIERESGQFSGPVCSQWEKFPTQSPICNRNDGLPSELSGITFPKWRNESIKAMGNAIVPQVAFEIFKAIEAYERL